MEHRDHLSVLPPSVGKECRLGIGMKHHRKDLLSFLFKTDVRHTLVVMKISDFQLGNGSSTTPFMQKQCDDRSDSKSSRRRDVRSIQKPLHLLVSERRRVSLIRSCGVAFQSGNRIKSNGIQAAEIIVEG